MLPYETHQPIDKLSWKKVGQTIVDTVGEILNIDIAILHYSNPQQAIEEYFIYQKVQPEYQIIDESLLRLTIKSIAEISLLKNPLIEEYDPQKADQESPAYWACLKANIRSTISLPLFYQRDLIASLTMHRCQEATSWQSQEIKLAQTMATQAALAISQVRAYERSQALARRETTINRITAAIRSSLEPQTMFMAIAKELGEALQVDGCSLSLWTKHDRFVKCVGLYNPQETETINTNPQAWRKATTSTVPIAENPILQALLFTKKTVSSADLEQQWYLARYELPWHRQARALLIVPLITEGEIIGSITLRQSHNSRSWQTEEIELAEIVAAQAALAISQVLAYTKVTTINRISATIHSSSEPQTMFKTIVRELGQALEVDACILSLWTKQDKFMKCVGLYNPQETEQIDRDGSTESLSTTSVVPIAENPLLQKLLSTKKPVLSEDLEQQQELARAELPWYGNARALLLVPLIAEGEIIGSITLRQTDLSRSWQVADIELAEIVASQAALAIAKMLAYIKVTTLNRITATIRSSLEPQTMFTAIAQELGIALKVDACIVSLWTKQDKFMKCVGLYNRQETVAQIKNRRDWDKSTASQVPIGDNPLLRQLLSTKKPVLSEDLEQQQEIARAELPWRSKARALLLVPLIVEGEIIGSITLRQSDTSRSWNTTEIDLAEAVASQAAIALTQAKLYETTRRQAQLLQIKEQKVRDLNNYLTESILKRFLPEAIVNKAATGKLALDLNPELRRITVLFCDLVSFTKLSRQLGSRLLAEILDEYLEVMSKAVFERGGTVDKFIGDAVMAMFGAPEILTRHEQAQRAIATARTMHLYLEQLNQRWKNKNLQVPPLQMRCGIHQGRAVVGMFGGSHRKDYTAIGQVVNIAARLQGAAQPNSILISKTVASCLPKTEIPPVQYLQLKGLEQAFPTFTLNIKQPGKH